MRIYKIKLHLLIPKVFFITFLASSTYATELTPAFKRFILKNESYVKSIVQKAHQINNTSPLTCRTVHKRQRLIPDILSKAVFESEESIIKRIQDSFADAEEKPDMDEIITLAEQERLKAIPLKGQWVEHIEQTGCQHIKQINILAVAVPDSLPRLFGMHNGTTITDRGLQDLTELEIKKSAKKEFRNCSTENAIAIDDTELKGFFDHTRSVLGKTNEGYGWEERWSAMVCSKTIDFQIKFYPRENKAYKIIVQPYDDKI